VGPSAGLDFLDKRNVNCLCRNSNPGPSSPQRGHFTDCSGGWLNVNWREHKIGSYGIQEVGGADINGGG
jgi:hypothetical protein